MSPETATLERRARRVRRTSADRLRDALLGLGAGEAQLLAHKARPWASITFEGSRHSFELLFEGTVAVERGESFIAELPDHEFALPGQLVADAQITEVEHRALPRPLLTVKCEILLLADN